MDGEPQRNIFNRASGVNGNHLTLSRKINREAGTNSQE